MKIPILLLLLFCWAIGITVAHVRLTFPPARYPPLDFLDNSRTAPPCGVPKPPADFGLRTSLKKGSTFNVTWSLSYPHQGGFRIEILDAKDQLLHVLTPEQQEYIGINEPTSQNYEVTLPNEDCENCVIRLLRQAKEWSNAYQFWSCADVNIVDEPKDQCAEHGKFANGKCQCERLYSGDHCQFKDECWTDQDCGSAANGKCLDLDVVTYPRRVCYCEPGWFGPGCQQISPLKNANFDVSLYQQKSFGEDENKLFWRILDESNEIEMVLQYPSRTWISIGWKPKNLSPQCSNLNNLVELLYGKQHVHGATQPTHGAKPEPEPEPEPGSGNKTSNASSIAEPHPTKPDSSVTGLVDEITTEQPYIDNLPNELGNGSHPFTIDVPIKVKLPFFPINGTKSHKNETVDNEYTDDVTEDILPPSKQFPTGLGNSSNAQSGVTVGTGPYPSGGIKPDVDVESEIVGDVCYGEWRWPPNCRDCDYKLSWTYIEDIDEIEFSVETRSVGNGWTGVGFSKTGNLQDSDFLVLKSVDGKLSAQDMYTSGKNPIPQPDPQQNINLPQVIGTHIGDVLRAAFSRPRVSTDTEHDVQFTDEDCFYFVFPIVSGPVDSRGKLGALPEPPVISKEKVCIKTCNPSGVPAVVKRTCDREFKFPPGCQQAACDYYATWEYNLVGESVSFNISSRELGRWTGIGFSKNGNMTNSDIVIGWVYENGTYITDRFAYGKQQPTIDKQQDLTDIKGRIVDDVQTLSFTRKLVSKDEKEDLSLKECLYFMFPVGGGRVLARSTGDLQDKTTPVGFHDLYVPKVSKTPICICTDDGIPVSGANITSARRSRRAAASHAHAQTNPPEYEYYDDNATDIAALNASDNFPLPPIATDLGSKGETSKPGGPKAAAPKSDEKPAKGEASPKPEPSPEPETKAAPKSNGTAEPEPTHEPNPKGEPHSHAEPTPEGEPGSALHPMDCADIIMGSAVGSLSRVEDFYTINRASPLVDEVYGGIQSLTAAAGFESNGITTIMFRRKLITLDAADHNISDSAMTVIWAKGQETGHYDHSPKSGLEGSDGKTKPFYGADVLAYHGHKNRGVLTLNFFEKPSKSSAVCRGEQVFPIGCQGLICQYNISWVRVGDNVDFLMDVKMSTNRWTGIGFSKDGAMAKSDAVIVQVNPSGPVEITDRYMPTYSKPLIDKVQNIFNVDAQYVNGRVKAHFSRAVATDDSQQDLNLTDCVFFLFPFEGGPVLNNEVQKHTETPHRSEKICFNKCSKESIQKDKQPEAVPANQSSKKYLLILKILNEKWSDALLDSNSDEFVGLSNKVVSAVNTVLSSKFTGYQKAEILRFRSGSVIADVQVIAAGLNEKDILDTVASSSEVQSLRIDPNSVQVREIQDHPTPDEIRNYVIIAVACFLVIVATVFAVCMLLRTKRRKSKDLKANRTAAPFSPHAYMMPATGTYPPAYQYPSPDAARSEKKQQFDSQAYHPEYHQAQQRSQPKQDDKVEPEGSQKSGPTGRSETTYNEWFSKVNSQPQHGSTSSRRRVAPGEQQQGFYGMPVGYPPPQPTGAEPYSVLPAPYVQYPNDPYGYYTLNGNSRVMPRGGYYAPY